MNERGEVRSLSPLLIELRYYGRIVARGNPCEGQGVPLPPRPTGNRGAKATGRA